MNTDKHRWEKASQRIAGREGRSPSSDCLGRRAFFNSSLQEIIANLPAGTKAGDYITSLEVTAQKPGADCCREDCCGAVEAAHIGGGNHG
jgi:hypothetical protein